MASEAAPDRDGISAAEPPSHLTTPEPTTDDPAKSESAKSESAKSAPAKAPANQTVKQPPPGPQQVEDNVVRERNQEYCRRGKRALLADVYRPRGDGPFPAVLMIHGGAWLSGSKWQVGEHANRAARRGYVVVAINYRLAPADKFPAQIDDCREAIRWMRREAVQLHLDPERIAAYGYSAGGHLASLLALSASHPEAPPELAETRIAVVVAGGAPCDFRHLAKDDSKLAYFLGGTRRQNPEAYRLASAAEFVSAAAPPFHFFHGNRDGLVPIISSRRLFQQMKTSGLSVSYDEVDGQGHLGTFFNHAAAERAVDFLDEHLQLPLRVKHDE